MKKIVIMFIFIFIFSDNVLAERDVLTNIECIDGDTIRAKINNEKETIRFLAIDTPETKYSTHDKDEPFAEEASKFTCNRIKDSLNVEIEYDSLSSKTDKYGRVLGWIFVDDVLLQKELIEKGYAKVNYVYDDYMYLNDLKKAEQEAKNKKIGIWNNEDTKNEIKEEDDIFDKILKYVWDQIKILFEKIYEKIKSYLKSKISNIFS